VNERRRKADEAAKRSATLESAPALAAWQAFVAARGTEKRKGKIRWGALSRRDYDRVAQEGGRPITRGRRNGRTTTQIGALRPLLAFPLREITAERVRAWLRDEVALRPTHAALAYRLLCAFLRWAAAHKEYSGQIDTAVCTAKDVRNELQKATPKADCLQREQLKPWFNAVGKLPNPTHRVYLQTLLLTGARREDLAALEWANVDFKWGSLTIHDKVQGSRVVPLTPYVASLLRELQRRNVRPLKPTAGEEWKPSPWVFASARAKNGRIQEPRIAHNRALDAAGLPPTTLHGLRRSFGTLSEWVEAPVGVVAQVMGHAPSAIAEKHYRVRPLDLLRAWHTKIEAWMLTEAGIEFDPEQVSAVSYGDGPLIKIGEG
jgi:integrase